MVPPCARNTGAFRSVAEIKHGKIRRHTIRKRERAREKKINPNSIMDCPLLRNAFAALMLILLCKGKFSAATLLSRH